MKGDKAQTRPERRTPPLREPHEGKQMKGHKAQTRPERRTPPLRRHMKGDKGRETRHRQDRRGEHHQSQRGGHILRKN